MNRLLRLMITSWEEASGIPPLPPIVTWGDAVGRGPYTPLIGVGPWLGPDIGGPVGTCWFVGGILLGGLNTTGPLGLGP